jgi:hypothetical protein
MASPALDRGAVSEHRVYRRVETDEEYRDRLWRDGRAFPDYINTSEGMDGYSWGQWRVQRKIVEDSTERRRVAVETKASPAKAACPKCGGVDVEPFTAPMVPPGSWHCIKNGHVWWTP